MKFDIRITAITEKKSDTSVVLNILVKRLEKAGMYVQKAGVILIKEAKHGSE